MARNGAVVNPQQLLLYLHEQGLSKYDMPEYFLQVDEIPLSANGKVLKRALVPSIESGRLSPKPVRWQGA
jgi:acyl-CoA synthetase